MDSISPESPDYASLSVGITDLASELPDDAAGRFTDLPFVVRSIWRFMAPTGERVLAATLERQINQEATPLQERTLLIAERAPDDVFVTRYYNRVSGEEETIESTDVVAAMLLGSSRTPSLVLLHDYGDATAYGLVARGENGGWSARWVSTRRHCSGED
jgi:hypothetical protein